MMPGSQRSGKPVRLSRLQRPRVTEMRDDERQTEQARHLCQGVVQLAERVGLRDATITVARHMSDVATVDVQLQGTTHHARPRRRGRVGTRNYNPEQVRRMFQLLLKILLKHCNVRFGKIEMQLSGGSLTNVLVTERFRPHDGDELGAMGDSMF